MPKNYQQKGNSRNYRKMQNPFSDVKPFFLKKSGRKKLSVSHHSSGKTIPQGTEIKVKCISLFEFAHGLKLSM